MADIVLATLNARFIHAAFGLRCLVANLGELRPRTALLEFDLDRRPIDVVESVLSHDPRIVGLGVYIWNVRPLTEVVALLKRLRPGLTVILGGPEVSYESEQQAIVAAADCTIAGEADLEFAAVCHQLLAGGPPPSKLVTAPAPNLAQVRMPYDLYSERDLAERVVYVEASRGCPYGCEFCLSSRDIPVRAFPLAAFLAAIEQLITRGLKRFKFVDRTFNLDLESCRAILDFFRVRARPDWLLHFEFVPDRLPPELRETIRGFPPGTVQLEVGIQTLDEATARRIRRHQDWTRSEDNLRFLRTHTGVHVHADLILGLPGESLPSFAAGFDQLVRLGPQEIQVGILKRLRGTSIGRHDAEWGMVYSPLPPYELLENRLIDFATLQRLRRFARYWDLLANSGNFLETLPLFWANGASPFATFLDFSDWLAREVRRQHAIALPRLFTSVYRYLTTVAGHDAATVRPLLERDYARGGRRGELPRLEPTPAPLHPSGTARQSGRGRRRQDRHAGGN